MSKYIIDTGDYLFTTDGVLVVGFDCDNKPATFYSSLDNLEELNSDYINEHYGELQDEAYQAGLNDMWEAVKKIFGYEIDGALNIDELGEAFGYKKEDVFCTADIIRANTAEQAIAKLKAYEDKQKADRIEVGDEVKHHFQGYGVVTRIKEVNGNTHYNAVWSSGNTGYYDPDDLTKTGKHYDIASILEAMRTHD